MKENRISNWYPFAQSAALYPDAQCLWSREKTYSFAETHDQAARYAQWLLAQGCRPGDIVTMYLINSPEFLIIWLAIMSIGCAPAFINYNLEGPALVHCLKVANSKLTIADDDAACRKRIEGSREEIEKTSKIIFLDDALQREISATPANLPGDKYREGVTPSFPFCIIYTRYATQKPP